MEKQALIVLLCNMVILIVLMMNVFISTNNNSKLISIVFIILFVIPFAIIQTYSINCMISGNCSIFSWALAGAILVCTVLYIIYVIMHISKEKRS
jgi:hypothetical protein